MKCGIGRRDWSAGLLVSNMNIRLAPGLLRPFGYISVLLAMLLLAGGTAKAQGPDQELLYDEREAQSIDRMLMCPVCAGTNIDQSAAVIAQQMQGIVREMLAQGSSREEVLVFFVDRYGTSVLAAPPKSGINLLAWILPVVGVLAALAAVFAIIRSMASHGARRMATDPALDDDLDPYLEAIDQELTLSQDISIRTGADHLGLGPPKTNENGQDASTPGDSGVKPPKEDGPKRNG